MVAARPGDPMTFEQWWAENGNGPIEYSRRLWDAALDAALEKQSMYTVVPIFSGIVVDVNDIEMLKISPSEVAQTIHEARGRS